jgi:oligopeptide/dipeptide ABC transporter ATP-binding protein
MAGADAHLSVRDLRIAARHREQDQIILDGVDLDLRRGEIVGIVGESGSGKSTLCRAIARILPPNMHVCGGSIRLGNADLLAMPAHQVHAIRQGGIGMIFQEPKAALNPVMRIGDQIVEAIRAHRDIGRREAVGEAVELLRRLGIDRAASRLDDHVHQFSGGQSQRLAIVAIAGNASVLLCDEPTSALDVTTQAQIITVLREIAAERQLSVVFVSHNYAVVAALCPRTVVLYGGRVVESGPTAELLLRSRHPYTSALIESMPNVDRRAERLAVIPGRPPAPGEITTGCRFAPRCRHVRTGCRSVDPVLAEVAAGHLSACIRAADIWSPTAAGPPPAGRPAVR